MELAQEIHGDPGARGDGETEAGGVLQAGPPTVRAAQRVADVAWARDARDRWHAPPQSPGDTDERGLDPERAAPATQRRGQGRHRDQRDRAAEREPSAVQAEREVIAPLAVQAGEITRCCDERE